MKRRLTVLCAALALALAACSGTAGESAPLAASATPSPAVEPVTVKYGISNSWDALMPYNSVSGSNYARIVYDKIYDRLAYVHAEGTLSPRAAKSWESADGGYAIVFHLDERSAFHDGTPVTAEHWARTFELMTDPACPTLGRGNFAGLVGTDEDGCRLEGEPFGAEAADPYTFKLTFQDPVIPEDFLLEKNREFYVLPTHLLENVDPAELMDQALWQAPIGSGPCKFVSEVAGSQLRLAANPGYPLGAPGFDELVVTVMDKSNLLTALIAGDLDYYAIGGSVSAEDAEVARSHGLEVLQGTVPNTFYELMLNNETLPDARLRRAVELALDKELLCLQSSQGLGQVTGSCVVPTSVYAPQEKAQTAVRDLEEAEALLTEAGYDGRTFTLACISSRAGLAALMQQNLAEAGIRVEIETVDSATLFGGMSDGIYDMAIASHTPNALPLWFVESRFAEGNNLFHVADLSPYQALISAVRTERDQPARQALVEELDTLLARERPFIPLWFSTALHVQSPTVTGIDYPSASFSNENVWDWAKH